MKKAALLTALIFIALLLFGCTAKSEKQRQEQAALPAPVYDISAELLPDEKALNVVTTVTYACPADDISAVKFMVYPNAYNEGHDVVTQDKLLDAYPHGKPNFGGAEMLSLECDRQIANSDLGQQNLVLTVRLSDALKRGETVRFTIAQKVTLANVKHRLGHYDGYYYLSDFYPEVCPYSGGKYLCYDYPPYGDPFIKENARYSFTFKFPIGFECACSAREISREKQGNFEMLSYEAECSRDVAAVASQKLRHTSIVQDETTLSYYYADGADKQKILTLLSDGFAFYSERFGAYPYPTFTLVAAPFFEAGVEHAGLAAVSKDLTLAQKKKTILHELAHQWWFGKVGNDQYQSPWVDEGLAEYSVACYYCARGFVNVAREMVSNAEDAYAIRLAIKGSEGVRFDKPLPNLAEGYYDRVYCGGFLLFCTLSELFGEDAFCLALKTFAEKYQGDTPAPSDLILSLSTSLGKDLTSLFRAWLTGTVPLQ